MWVKLTLTMSVLNFFIHRKPFVADMAIATQNRFAGYSMSDSFFNIKFFNPSKSCYRQIYLRSTVCGNNYSYLFIANASLACTPATFPGPAVIQLAPF